MVDRPDRESFLKRLVQMSILMDVQNAASGKGDISATRTKALADRMKERDPDLYQKFGLADLIDPSGKLIPPQSNKGVYKKVGLDEIPLTADGKFVPPGPNMDLYQKAGISNLPLDANGNIGEFRRRPVVRDDPAPPSPPVPESSPAAVVSKTSSLTVQQQQAYLKMAGIDTGKDGLSGQATEATAKALEEFAKKKGIDPKDTQKVQEALANSVKGSETAKQYIDKMKHDIDAGRKISHDEAVMLQWVLKGNNAGMPVSLRKDGTMDGIVGPETKTATRVIDSDMKASVKRDREQPAAQPDKVELKTSPELQRFYDSLTPEQREIQKKIAELGGSQSLGEEMGLWDPDGSIMRNHNRLKTINGNIYDGGFNVPIKFPYEPSDEVRQLKDTFDKSLTPEQKQLRDAYIESQKLPEITRDKSRDIYTLFRENGRDLFNKPPVLGPVIEYSREVKKVEVPVDQLGGCGVKCEIDLTGGFNGVGAQPLLLATGLGAEGPEGMTDKRVESVVRVQPAGGLNR